MRKVASMESGILEKWYFGKVVSWESVFLGLGKMGFWESGILEKWNFGKVIFWKSGIWGKWNLGKVVVCESGFLVWEKWCSWKIGFRGNLFIWTV